MTFVLLILLTGQADSAREAVERLRSLLNAIRRPEVTRRLHERLAGADLAGPLGEVLERVVREAGLKLEGPTDSPLARGWRSRHFWLGDEAGRLNAFRALEWMSDGPYSFVLEDDRVRILPIHEALDFWAAWWAAEPKK